MMLLENSEMLLWEARLSHQSLTSRKHHLIWRTSQTLTLKASPKNTTPTSRPSFRPTVISVATGLSHLRSISACCLLLKVQGLHCIVTWTNELLPLIMRMKQIYGLGPRLFNETDKMKRRLQIGFIPRLKASGIDYQNGALEHVIGIRCLSTKKWIRTQIEITS